MAEAALVASWSRDPSTKCGSVIVDSMHRQQSQGFNGFPRGVLDLDERYNDRPTKYAMIVHAEANAVVTARKDLTGCRLYTTMFPCSGCAKLIIQAGIIEVICPEQDLSKPVDQRWADDAKFSRVMFEEAQINVFEIVRRVVRHPDIDPCDQREAGLKIDPTYHRQACVDAKCPGC